jgi:hypothetical protein
MPILPLRRADDGDCAAVPQGRVLVALPVLGEGQAALECGMGLVQGRGGRLTLLGVAAPPSALAYCSMIAPPYTLEGLREEVVAEASRGLATLLAGLPPDVSVEHRLLVGAPHRVIGAALARGDFSAAVLHAPWRRSPRMRRAVRSWRHAGHELHLA